ncbi:MAG: DJ-1/PfpI family protein [Oscillospiraceae bacterium]|nr:DJ-1/PfpI family protein [Oscillospiraceae bacterium]
MVVCFLANGFEEIEALTPIDCLRRCGIDVLTVGVGSSVINGSHHIPVVCDTDTDSFEIPDNFEMLILPGGMPGTLNLEKSDVVQYAIDYCTSNNIPIAAICAAPLILGHKEVLEGKRATCYPGFEKDLIGAEVLDENVVADGDIITACGMGAALDFSLALVEKLVSKKRADELLKSLKRK